MEEEINLERTIEELKAGIALEENFRRLFVRFWPHLDRFFARQGIPRQERGDLTQETFLGIYSGIASFRREARFESWIFTIAANVYRKYLRHRAAGKRAATELALDEPGPADGAALADRLTDESPAGHDPERALLDDERYRRWLEALDELPDRMRQCLILRIFQDLTYDEIAVLMRLSPETVRSHLFQARQRLGKLLVGSADGALDNPGNPLG